MKSKLLLLIMSVPPHPSCLRDKLPRRGEGSISPWGLLAAHADHQEVLMLELTLFDGLFAAVPGKR